MMECFSDQKREGLLGDPERMKITSPLVFADTHCKLHSLMRGGPGHTRLNHAVK